MIIRIFATGECGFEKYLNFLRLEHGNGRPWNITVCDPMTWLPASSGAGASSSVADIQIHVAVPLRLAIPWARFNVYLADTESENWAWTKTDMDHTFALAAASERSTALKAFRNMLAVAILKQHPPTAPQRADGTAKIAVITPTRNRRAWWSNMVANVMRQSWPLAQIEWIIVDDGDEGQRLGTDVEEFVGKSPGITIRYIEITTGQKTIGFKRNAAVEAAGADVDLFVCMDDDDHYPRDSIATRVAWLSDKRQIAYCSVIAMYDLRRYISAMSVSELGMAPAKRVSEATLAFTREAWNAKQFPDESMAEGAGFLEARESVSVEIPPNSVIVSFIHTGNISSRRIPKEQEANGCHYGFADDYFKYLHKIGGGMVE